MQDFILNEIYDLIDQRKWIKQASSDAYSLYKQLSNRETNVKKEIEKLILQHKLYFPLDHLQLYAGFEIRNIDLVFKYKGEIRTENIWCGKIDSVGFIESTDESEYEINYEDKDGIINYQYISYEPYNSFTIPNVIGFMNLEYVSDGKSVIVDYNIPDKTYKS